MNIETTPTEQKFGITPDELEQWEENGYFIRHDVFSKTENDVLRQVADDIVEGKRPGPTENMKQNAWVRDGKVEASGIHAMHSIHHINCYVPEFLNRTRDPRLTDPITGILGPNVLGLNNLYIWKPPKIGLGFPWHQDKWYFNNQYITEKTVGTWSAIDKSDEENGCLYVIPGSHKLGVLDHEDLDGSQQNEFKIVRAAKDEDGVAVEVPPGAVVWFNNQVLHKSTHNHSDRFRRCSVAHYISADSERIPGKNRRFIRPVMWVRGETYSEKMEPVYRDVLPFPESN